MIQRLQKVIEILESEPFYLSDGEAAKSGDIDEPEGTLSKEISKTLCLSMVDTLRQVDAELKRLLNSQIQAVIGNPDYKFTVQGSESGIDSTTKADKAETDHGA